MHGTHGVALKIAFAYGERHAAGEERHTKGDKTGRDVAYQYRYLNDVDYTTDSRWIQANTHSRVRTITPLLRLTLGLYLII